MDAPDAKWLRGLESENAMAEAHLDIHVLKGVFGIKCC